MSAPPANVTLRAATPADTADIVALIHELAEYERLLHEVVVTEETLRASLFGEGRVAEVVLAHSDNTLAAFCLFFHNFSTFLGQPGLYIEDIYVRSAFRGQHIGTAFFTHLSQLALERKCGRMEWSVLDWNQPAIDFYHRLGAKPMDGWTVHRLDASAFSRLAISEERCHA